VAKRRAVIYRGGFRYWMSKTRLRDGRTRFLFWSSHDWPFYHGHFTTEDKREAFAQFKRWIPTADC